MKTRQELEQIAEYWDCCESERLTHTTLEDALGYVIDGWLDPRQNAEEVEQTIRRHAPYEVDCYVRNQWTDAAIGHYANYMFDALCEHFDEDEDFGDPDEYVHSKFDIDQKASIMLAAGAFVAEFAKHTNPWGCSFVGRVVIDADEAVRMMRDANPTWFDKP